MTTIEKNAIYDKVCIALTDYENSEDTEESNQGFLEEFYSLLVEISANWEELTGEEDE